MQKENQPFRQEPKLLSVTTVDGVCYVNFDAGFTNQDYEIQEPIVIYSIVNSLSELSTVSKFRFLSMEVPRECIATVTNSIRYMTGIWII